MDIWISFLAIVLHAFRWSVVIAIGCAAWFVLSRIRVEFPSAGTKKKDPQSVED